MTSYVNVNLGNNNAKELPISNSKEFITFDDIPSPEHQAAPSYDHLAQPPNSYSVTPAYRAPQLPSQPFSAPTQPVGTHTQGFSSYPTNQDMPVVNNNAPVVTAEQPKMEVIKKWTVQHYKYTKQLLTERMGHATKTVDKELDDRIEELRQSKLQYGTLLKESRILLTRFEAVVKSHREMRAQFQGLIAQTPSLQHELQTNATTQSILERNGEALLGAIRMFADTLSTLVNVTMQDTLITVRNYENARVEYDAYRNEISTLTNQPQTEASKNKLLELQVIFEGRRQRWEALKCDTHTKLNLLNENKLMVVKQQLNLFNSATLAYFSGNGEKLSEVLAEYHIKTKPVPEDPTIKSFLGRNE